MPAKTLDEVISRLESIVDSASESGNPLGIFALVYLGVTRMVKQCVINGTFEDCARMEKLDVIFANRYINAYDLFRQEKECTHAWRTAFEASSHFDYLTLQHLLMGMNAHINLDLGIAAAQVVPAGQLPSLANDFFKINDLLCEQIEAMQDKLSQVSPLLFLLDVFGRKSDEKFAAFSLKKARAHAWLVANRLSKLSDTEQKSVIAELDEYVTVLNRLITNPGMYTGTIIKLVKWFEIKDVKKILAVLT